MKSDSWPLVGGKWCRSSGRFRGTYHLEGRSRRSTDGVRQNPTVAISGESLPSASGDMRALSRTALVVANSPIRTGTNSARIPSNAFVRSKQVGHHSGGRPFTTSEEQMFPILHAGNLALSPSAPSGQIELIA